MVGGTDAEMEEFECHIEVRFKMKRKGEIKMHLGIRVRRDRDARTIHLSQEQYVQEMLETYGMIGCAHVETPMDSDSVAKLRIYKGAAKEDMKGIPYREAIGSLMYLAIHTRPDIAAAVGICGKFVSNPTQEHWSAVKRIIRYVAGTIQFGLNLGGSKKGIDSVVLEAYSDSDWAGDHDDRKSRSGIISLICGSVVCYASKKQPVVATSSAEAERIAVHELAKDVVWVRQVLSDLGYKQSEPTQIYEDNLACIAQTKNDTQSSRSRHMDVKYHYARELVAAGVIQLTYVNTKEMMADILTKPLPRDQFHYLRDMMQVTSYTPVQAWRSVGDCVRSAWDVHERDARR
jgi:hypothetical protein